ncbi:MAG: hypothetical protein LKI39_12010 [Bacteroides sp.]|jgi:hypothetical protein|nr:hypothetical protein [Bacteroides sp.]MCI1683267.1 hypothetical protein [Bacteroides sp.]
MVYWKEEACRLESDHAYVIIVDGYDKGGIPVFISRKVIRAVGMVFGKDSYWGVEIDHPLRDGEAVVVYSCILLWSISALCDTGERLNYYTLKKFSGRE